MAAKLILLAFLICSGFEGLGAQPVPGGRDLPKFLGRAVTIVEPELEADGLFPRGPASIWVEGPPEREC
jgi:hypothetical protein